MKKIIIRVVLILIILAVIALYTYEIVTNHATPTENIFRCCVIVLFAIVAFVRTFQTGRRKTLDFYDRQYADILKEALPDQPFWRKKLLCAVRLYNEDQYEKALKYLSDLKHKAKTNADHYAIDLFTALCFTEMKLYDHAIHIYQHLISTGKANSRIFSNLGHVQLQAGKYRDALQNY